MPDAVKANYHTHSTLCDGSDLLADVAAYACSNGFTHLGFSGHMDFDNHMDIEEYYRQVHVLQEEYKGRMDILRGIELDILYPKDCLYDAEYWIGSTHFVDVPTDIPMSVDNTPEILEKLCNDFFDGDYYALARNFYDLEAQVYERTRCTFVGHFDLVVKFNDKVHFLDEEDPRYRRYALEAMEHLVRQGVPFEINCGAVNRGRKKELYPNSFLLKSLHDLGGQIYINADAHQKELLCGGFDTAVRSALAAGFTHTLILEHNEFGSVVQRAVALDLFRT